jgi:hypothetical protein
MSAICEFNAFVQLCKDGPTINYDNIKIHKYEMWKLDYESYDKENILRIPKIICKLIALIKMGEIIKDKAYYENAINTLYEFLGTTLFQNNKYVYRLRNARLTDIPYEFNVCDDDYLLFHMPNELQPIAEFLKMKKISDGLYKIRD